MQSQQSASAQTLIDLHKQFSAETYEKIENYRKADKLYYDEGFLAAVFVTSADLVVNDSTTSEPSLKQLHRPRSITIKLCSWRPEAKALIFSLDNINHSVISVKDAMTFEQKISIIFLTMAIILGKGNVIVRGETEGSCDDLLRLFVRSGIISHLSEIKASEALTKKNIKFIRTFDFQNMKITDDDVCVPETNKKLETKRLDQFGLTLIDKIKSVCATMRKILTTYDIHGSRFAVSELKRMEGLICNNMLILYLAN